MKITLVDKSKAIKVSLVFYIPLTILMCLGIEICTITNNTAGYLIFTVLAWRYWIILAMMQIF